MRSSVHVLHHPATARRVPFAVRRIDFDGSARARRGGTKELILIAQDTSMYAAIAAPAAAASPVARAARRHRIARVDPVAVSLSGHGRQRTDRRDGSLEKSAPTWICRCSTRTRRAARDAPSIQRDRYLEIIDEFRRRIPGVTMRSTFIVGFRAKRKSTSPISKRSSSVPSSIASASSRTHVKTARPAPIYQTRFPIAKSAGGSCGCAKPSASHRNVRARRASAPRCACSSKNGASCDARIRSPSHCRRMT